jgi:hypothetical protein
MDSVRIREEAKRLQGRARIGGFNISWSQALKAALVRTGSL